VLATVGCLAFGAGTIIYATRIGLEPSYVTSMLPGALLVGTGVGLTLPTLTATAAGALPPHRFATGSAVITMARQVGYTVGVAVLIAVLAKPLTAADRLVAFHHGWETIAAISFLGAAAASLLIRRPAPVGVPAPIRSS
jgi:hypothetical protein